jgi:hypothetical protein
MSRAIGNLLWENEMEKCPRSARDERRCDRPSEAAETVNVPIFFLGLSVVGPYINSLRTQHGVARYINMSGSPIVNIQNSFGAAFIGLLISVM